MKNKLFDVRKNDIPANLLPKVHEGFDNNS